MRFSAKFIDLNLFVASYYYVRFLIPNLLKAIAKSSFKFSTKPILVLTEAWLG